MPESKSAFRENITYRLMEMDEAERASQLALDSFREFVGHEYSQEGRDEFQRYVSPDALRQRVQRDHFALVAMIRDDIVGVIEIRHNQHISLLFVKKRFHHRGIAKELVRRALVKARRENPRLERVTVNSSRYAAPVYERLGFRRTGSEQTVNGITFIPLEIEGDRIN